MKVKAFLLIVCIVSLTFPNICGAQGNEWTVITSTRDTLRSCIIGRLEGNMVNLTCDSSVIQISVDSLSMLTRHEESQFWTGAGYGTIVGAAVGIIVGVATYQKPTYKHINTFIFDTTSHTWRIVFDFIPFNNINTTLGYFDAALAGGILGGVTGFTTGGIVGALSGGNEKYDLSKEPTEEKIKILRDLRRENR